MTKTLGGTGTRMRGVECHEVLVTVITVEFSHKKLNDLIVVKLFQILLIIKKRFDKTE